MTNAAVPVFALLIAVGVGAVVGLVLAGIAPRFMRSSAQLDWRASGRTALATAVAAGVVTAAVGSRLAATSDAPADVAGFALRCLAFALATAAVIVISVVDQVEHRIPNVIVLPVTAALLALLAVAALLDGRWSTPLAAIIGAAALLALYAILALVSRGGLGMGDVKLAALVGAMTGAFGLEAAAIGMLAGFAIGAGAALVAILTRRATRATPIAFGPSMVAGAFVALAVAASV